MSEAQRLNAKMMRFMPFMFLVFLYFFSSALVLYWTIQNLMTIFQTLITKTATEPNSKSISKGGQSALSDEVEVSPIKEISEEERKCRNLLFKSKGPIDRKKLTKNFELRMLNYEEEKLEKMSASKRRSS